MPEALRVSYFIVSRFCGNIPKMLYKRPNFEHMYKIYLSGTIFSFNIPNVGIKY